MPLDDDEATVINTLQAELRAVVTGKPALGALSVCTSLTRDIAGMIYPEDAIEAVSMIVGALLSKHGPAERAEIVARAKTKAVHYREEDTN